MTMKNRTIGRLLSRKIGRLVCQNKATVCISCLNGAKSLAELDESIDGTPAEASLWDAYELIYRNVHEYGHAHPGPDNSKPKSRRRKAIVLNFAAGT